MKVVEGFELSKEVADPSKMTSAREFLEKKGVSYAVQTAYHLKIFGSNGKQVNYYPTTGAVNLDGQPKFSGRGLDFLAEILSKLGIMK